MKRTDAEGNIGNRYSEGNPATGVPATVVGDSEMNNIQEELANAIEAAGITLDGNDEEQLLQALNVLIQNGGTTQTDQTLLNALATPTNVGGLQFNGATYKAIRVVLDLWRKTDSTENSAIVDVAMIYKPTAAAWAIKHQSQGDSMGVHFSITGAGQLQYTSDDLLGTSYEGKIRIAKVERILTTP